MRFRRICLVVLDSAGIGAMPDAADWGDSGSDTLGNILKSRDLHLPNLQNLGLGNIRPLENVPPIPDPIGSFGKCTLRSNGKDTTTGHWEMAGIILKEAFPTYPDGFPPRIIDEFVSKAEVPGILGNIPASGTEIIKELGEEHVRTGKPIVYTSADSVFQIAAHEEVIPVGRLYEICEIARKILDGEDKVGRVIARPFLGSNSADFKRTENRHDYAVPPPSNNLLPLMKDNGLDVVCVGKIASIYDSVGVTQDLTAKNNDQTVEQTINALNDDTKGLIFSNMVDFDMLYGHRRDTEGYAKALERFDEQLPSIFDAMREDDLLILTADHGNDPTFPGSDHTREYVPLLAYGRSATPGVDLGTRGSLADIGQTVADNFGLTLSAGVSFLPEIRKFSFEITNTLGSMFNRPYMYVSIFVSILFLPFLCQSQVDRTAAYTESPSRLRGVIETFVQDNGAINRLFTAQASEARGAKLRQLFSDNLLSLGKLNFDSLNQDEQVDYVLFNNYLRREIKQLDRSNAQFVEMAAIIPFAKTITDLEDQRRRLETIDAEKSAAILDQLAKQINALPKSFEANRPKRTVANRALQTIANLRTALRNWFNYRNTYDPVFTWWAKKPYEAVEDALQKYSTFVASNLVCISPDDKTTIIGDPIGREALIEELEFEMIPYSPEELLEIANKEFAWTQAELKKASREMGFGDDYMKAIEAVKQKYVEPGKQPDLIRDLAREAIDYVEKNKLVTVPQLAKDTWRMEMMTPERQLVAPFFLGGETILVSYPTDSMTQEQKLMSLRGNNPHFARAVTHHELIPGHHLQQFMTRRYRPYRSLFGTPFWTEGWALYWEFLLWDMGFNKTPEDKIGALFWRSHRAARIIFSLNFHLGKMTPNESVDLLVNKVGHERENALAEVRRSFGGDYGPLYQIAYMMGGLQFYSLQRDMVGSKKMTNQQFHDAVLREGPIPVEMVRAAITNQKLTRDHKPSWRYYDLTK